MKNSKILIISGPSGAGKSTVCRYVMEYFGEKFSFAVSATTRPMRGKERNGVEYHFFSKDEYKALLYSDQIFDHKILHTYYYGTLKSELEQIWSENKIPIMDINAEGSMCFRQHYEVYSIFITPPSMEVLEKRLRDRGENDEESLTIRLQEAKKEIGRSHLCDFVIVNEKLETTLEEITKVVKTYLKGE